MLINIAGSLLILFIVWWFWLAKPQAKVSRQNDIVEVIAENGVYSPSLIQTDKGQSLTLRFVRKDANPCAEKVIFSDLNKSADLPLNEPRDVTLIIDTPGTYEFTCQMGMYRGKLLVQ
ncbi:MAG: plastocyanin [Gammaproteobacteria bacterium SG8_11]|nr:MAG: plastocyanin [Gammaproteobacteria bacterium SG8_11]